MEKRDYLKKQVDQLARVLAKILADLLGLKSLGKIEEGIEMVKHALAENLNIDMLSLIEIPDDQFIEALVHQYQFTKNSLEPLADILLGIADESAQGTEDLQESHLYKKCLVIYEYLQRTDDVLSFERHVKIQKIRDLLGTLE